MKRIALFVLPALLACGGPVADDLDAHLGGFDFSREEPLFGDVHRAEFEAAGESSAPQALTVAPRQADRRAWAVWAGWGHFLADRSDDTVLDWSGTLHTSDGVLSLLRTIAFDRHDRVLPPPDTQTVAFRSRTRPHFDGIVTRVESDGTTTLTFDTPTLSASLTPSSQPTYEEHALPDSNVALGFLAVPLDEAAPCAHAVVAGRIRPVGERERRRTSHEQRAVGRWLTPEGALVGHWRAFAGHNRRGEHVAYGKVIDADGNALALLRATVAGGIVHGAVLDVSEAEIGRFEAPLKQDGGRRYLLTTAAMSSCLTASPGPTR